MRVRCTQQLGHSGLCTPGEFENNQLEDAGPCTLERRTMDVFEADCCVVTYTDKWPELGQLPPHWSAVVDAEMDVVCFVPPHSSAPTAEDMQADSKQRAQIICDVLNAVQNEELK